MSVHSHSAWARRPVERLRAVDPVVLAAVAVVVGAAVRLYWVRYAHPPSGSLFSDMGQYVSRARQIADGGGLDARMTFQPPGAHLLLAGIFIVFGTDSGGMGAATAVWWLMSSVTPVLLGLFVAELVGRRAGAIAASLCALWPLYISYTGYFLGEIPGTFFLALTIFLLARAARMTSGRRYVVWAGAGAAAAATIGFRPQLAVVFLVAAGLGLLGLRRNWRGVLAATAAGAVVIGGLIAHNSIATGELTGLSGNSGDVFFHGQCHARRLTVEDVRTGLRFHTISSVEIQHKRGRNYFLKYRGNIPLAGRLQELGHPPGQTDAATRLALMATPEVRKFLFSRGLDCIEDHGLGHVRYWAENVLDGLAAVEPFPQFQAGDWTRGFARISNAAYSWYVPVLVAVAVVVLIRRRRRREPVRAIAFLLLAYLAWVPLAMVFFGSPRYRQPFDIFAIALFAALVAGQIGRSRQSRHGAPPPVTAEPAA